MQTQILEIRIYLFIQVFKFFNRDLKYFKNISNNIKKIDYIFHFAGNGELIPSIEKPFIYFKNNENPGFCIRIF